MKTPNVNKHRANTLRTQQEPSNSTRIISHTSNNARASPHPTLQMPRKLKNRKPLAGNLTELPNEILFLIVSFLTDNEKGFNALRVSCKKYYNAFKAKDRHSTYIKLLFLIPKLYKKQGWSAYLGNTCDINALKKAQHACYLLEQHKLITRETESDVYLIPQKFRKASSSSGRGYKELQTKKEYFVVRYIGE